MATDDYNNGDYGSWTAGPRPFDNSSWRPGNTYYNPTGTYGWDAAANGGAWSDTPLGWQYLEDEKNRDAAWSRYAGEMGWSPNTGRGRWAYSQLPRMVSDYKAALATNPNLQFNDFIRSVDLNSTFDSLTAQQRGETPGQFAPRTRTISRGY